MEQIKTSGAVRRLEIFRGAFSFDEFTHFIAVDN
jgi:hypothetical protein